MGAHNNWSIPQQQCDNQQKSIKWQKLSSFNLCPVLLNGMEQNLTPGDVAAGDESDQD